jgi:hypothetical protein
VAAIVANDELLGYLEHTAFETVEQKGVASQRGEILLVV